MPAWFWVAAQWFGIASAAVCFIVIAACVAAVVYDRIMYGRWLWRDER